MSFSYGFFNAQNLDRVYTAEDFTAYFDDVRAQKSLQANVREDAWPQPGDRVLTLSTCFRGDNHQRYLVQGKLVAEAYAK